MTEQRPFHAFARRLGDAISRASQQPESLGEAEFQALALQLFQLQYDSIVPYRNLCNRRRKTPQTVTAWRDIPALPTTAFKDLELTSLPPEERTNVFHSSGTTEQRPSRHFHSADSLAVYETSLLPWFAKHVLQSAAGFQPAVRAATHFNDTSKAETQPPSPSPLGGERAGVRGAPSLQYLALTPPPSSCPHSSLIHMFESVQKSFGMGTPKFYGELGTNKAWEIRFPEVFTTLENAIATGQPVLLLGTAFLFVHLLDELETRSLHFQLPTGSRLMETGGYKGRSRELPKAELHRLLAQRLGLPDTAILCEYGMSELSSQAYDRVCDSPAPRRFQFPPWARVVVVSPETGLEAAIGETGLVRIHDLANVWSIAAVQTEDLAIRHADGFELLGRAVQAEPRGCSLMAR
ncbi:MAG TPA: hypothetical protein VGH19_01210 [Verrucomicrobiae bacterium]